jgi:hypothetical protein
MGARTSPNLKGKEEVSMSQAKMIKLIDGFTGVSDTDVLARGTNVLTKLTGNADLPAPPLDLATLKAALDAFSAVITAALDGGKTAIAEKRKQRIVVIKMLRLLASYVEFACKDDMAIFETSGFQAAPTTKTTRPPLTEKIRKVEHGVNSGEITVWLKAVFQASSYEFRYIAANAGAGTPWTTMPLSNVKAPILLTGLTPATTYLLQARALVKDTFSDWSDSVSFMCT